MTSKKIAFTPSERELIIRLVKERPIIENKRTNARNIELKKKAWNELTLAYNAEPYVAPRNNIQLKRCWENIKTQRKKELSQETNNMRRTGSSPLDGGPSGSSENANDDIYPQNMSIAVPAINLECIKDEVDENEPLNPKKPKTVSSTNTGLKNNITEIEPTIDRRSLNVQQNDDFEKLRLERERTLLQRERNLMEYEAQLHNLQIEKITLEIEILKRKLE